MNLECVDLIDSNGMVLWTGHLVKEIDALDGLMGVVTDKAGIHYKMLNQRKGPAVWGPRAQTDRDMYKDEMQQIIASVPNLDIVEASVEDVVLNESNSENTGQVKHDVHGIVTKEGFVNEYNKFRWCESNSNCRGSYIRSQSHNYHWHLLAWPYLFRQRKLSSWKVLDTRLHRLA